MRRSWVSMASYMWRPHFPHPMKTPMVCASKPREQPYLWFADMPTELPRNDSHWFRGHIGCPHQRIETRVCRGLRTLG